MTQSIRIINKIAKDVLKKHNDERICLYDLGFQEYNESLKTQEQIHSYIKEKNINGIILTMNYSNLFTIGKSGKKSDILVSQEVLNKKGINVYESNRGGEITYHGPGQLICYFVLDLRKKKDIRKFITIIEKTIIQTLKFYKIETFPDKDNIGIWHKYNNEVKKIGAIGIRVKKWVAYHGFSINIENDLEYFKKIIPCGVRDKSVVSLKDVSKIKYADFLRKLEKKLVKNLLVSNYS